MDVKIEQTWKHALQHEFEKQYFEELSKFIHSEYHKYRVFPPAKDIFNAFNLCPLDKAKVVIVGQDPYHEIGQAMGLSFAVSNETKIPPSLVNIFSEIETDIGRPSHSDRTLMHWVKQGVFLLNATLTVREHMAASHFNKGWEIFTDAALNAIAQKSENVVFILWGAFAQKKGMFIDEKRHLVIKSAHPSPLSAYRGFFGSKPFSKTNSYLVQHDKAEIDW